MNAYIGSEPRPRPGKGDGCHGSTTSSKRTSTAHAINRDTVRPLVCVWWAISAVVQPCTTPSAGSTRSPRNRRTAPHATRLSRRQSCASTTCSTHASATEALSSTVRRGIADPVVIIRRSVAAGWPRFTAVKRATRFAAAAVPAAGVATLLPVRSTAGRGSTCGKHTEQRVPSCL